MFGNRSLGGGSVGGLRGLPAERVVAMEPEALARFVLRELRDRARANDNSLSNFGLAMRRQFRKDAAVMGAISEAVGLLRARVYIADDLSTSAEGSWFVVTRAGRAWLEAPVEG